MSAEKLTEPLSYVNLTPHRVAIYDGDAIVAEWEPSGTVARVAARRVGQGPDGVALVSYGDVVGLPLPRVGTAYIVSLVTALALRGGRDDVVAPYDEVRNASGAIVGCRAFQRIAP